ncbi:SdpI family protein [Marivirga sp. S37H4]|uniref:SdpI family protein n=1 Tax=Marivirga aurantiaca TaxID=2802615 RepID=A0A934WVW0_9BACT|nr:SdpI family protein [Marivirga aurantiaca]MBK6263810.1 SdpI family protein [Marivirga aurantiaca]
MKLTLKRELPLILVVLLPFAYLAFVWNDLPQAVPLHWNLEGEIDRYGNKLELLLIPILLPLLFYLIFLVVPKIDPKKKIRKMGNKYHQIKFILTGFMSMLALYILYVSKEQSLSSPNIILLIIGILYVILGNYFKTIKANYFIGIRTPWTLESEPVWNATHNLGGKMWFIGGLLVVIASMVLKEKVNIIVFIAITAIITIIPVLYSYFKFKELSK